MGAFQLPRFGNFNVLKHILTHKMLKSIHFFYNFFQNKMYKISLCSLQCTYHIVITNYKLLMTNSCWMPLIHERSPPNNESIPRRLKSLDDNVFISCTKLTVSPHGRLGVGHMVSRKSVDHFVTRLIIHVLVSKTCFISGHVIPVTYEDGNSYNSWDGIFVEMFYFVHKNLDDNINWIPNEPKKEILFNMNRSSPDSHHTGVNLTHIKFHLPDHLAAKAERPPWTTSPIWR